MCCCLAAVNGSTFQTQQGTSLYSPGMHVDFHKPFLPPSILVLLPFSPLPSITSFLSFCCWCCCWCFSCVPCVVNYVTLPPYLLQDGDVVVLHFFDVESKGCVEVLIGKRCESMVSILQHFFTSPLLLEKILLKWTRVFRCFLKGSRDRLTRFLHY